MKKKWAILTIAAMTFFAATISVSAAELRERTEATEHPWNEFVDSLDPNDYSGVYVKDDQLHIAAMDEPQMTRMVSRSRAASSIVVDEAAKYSYQELLDAQDRISEKYSDLGVSAIYLDLKNNNVLVRSKTEWNDERKQKVRECAEIENLVFQVHSGITIDVEEDESATTRAVPRDDEVINGDQFGTSGDYKSIGCGISFNDPSSGKKVYGYLTAGHGTKVGSTYKYNGEKLGTAVVVKNKDYLDVALIKEPASPVLYQSEHLLGNQSMTQTGAPYQDDIVYMFGYRSYQEQDTNEFPRIGKVTAVNGREFTDKDTGIVYEGLVEADYGRIKGDSGAPVTTIRSGSYVLVGIHHGNHYGQTYFVNFRDIKNSYGVNLVY